MAPSYPFLSWALSSLQGLFISLDNCRFRSTVRPGDLLRLPVEVLRARGDVFKFRGKAMVGDKVAAEVEFAAMVVETPA